MLFHKHQALAALLLSLFVRTLVSSLHRCGQEVCPDEHGCCPDEHGCCPDEHGCCPHGSNSSAVVCCQRLTSKTYYNIAMVTRKLSGVLLLLLLFALGYSLQRLLCSRTGRLAQAQNGHPAVTTSQDPLMESGTRRRGARLHEPIPRRADLPQVKPFGYLGDRQSAVHVLFVGEQDEGPPAQLLAPQRVLQLSVRLVQTLPVRTVHHEHDGRHVVVEALPVLPHLPLAADVPHGQSHVLPVLFGVQHLHVEADGGRSGDEGVVLQLVEEGRLPALSRPRSRTWACGCLDPRCPMVRCQLDSLPLGALLQQYLPAAV
uniref:Granulins domain-containing protein n=1 Tax=Takifugu rubripes TaxID=31033 RepID=A0A674N551_TAKRU